MANAYVFGPDILPDPNVFFMPHSKDAQTQVGLSYNFHGILSQCIVIFLFCVHIVVECEIGCKVSILDFLKWSLLFFIHGKHSSNAILSLVSFFTEQTLYRSILLLPKHDSVLNILGYFLEQFQIFS